MDDLAEQFTKEEISVDVVIDELNELKNNKAKFRRILLKDQL